MRSCNVEIVSLRVALRRTLFAHHRFHGCVQKGWLREFLSTCASAASAAAVASAGVYPVAAAAVVAHGVAAAAAAAASLVAAAAAALAVARPACEDRAPCSRPHRFQTVLWPQKLGRTESKLFEQKLRGLVMSDRTESLLVEQHKMRGLMVSGRTESYILAAAAQKETDQSAAGQSETQW